MSIDLKGTLEQTAEEKPILIVDGKVVDFIEMILRSGLMDLDSPKQVNILIERG